MRTRAAVSLALLLGSSVVRAQDQAAAVNPFLGFWKLNPGKSSLRDTPPGLVVFREYSDAGGGLMLHTIVGAVADSAGFTFVAAKYDGKEYPVFVAETLGTFLSSGAKPSRMGTFVRRDALTLEYTERINGRISSTGVNQVSEDGKTMTETVKAFDAQGKQTSSSVSVFDKTEPGH
jgi:hypothetical protein